MNRDRHRSWDEDRDQRIPGDEQPVQFRPTGSYDIAFRNQTRVVWTGPAPIDSTDAAGADWIGQEWQAPRGLGIIAAVRDVAPDKPIRTGDKIGLIFDWS